MEFVLTNHAKKRLIEREILDPDNQRLSPAGQGIRKRIRKSCQAEGIKFDKIYFVRDTKNENLKQREVHVYVCNQIDVNKYLVITCFKYIL